MRNINAQIQQARNVLLQLTDAQSDFMNREGALAIHPAFGCKEDASEIIVPINAFLARLAPKSVDTTVISFDTHFRDEYRLSPESKMFPNPHCLYATSGWGLAVKAAPLLSAAPAFLLAKNEFDMWGSNPTGVAREQILLSPTEGAAYDNLFKFIPLRAGEDPALRLTAARDGRNREAFLAERAIGPGTLVLQLGVAADVCDAFAAEGYLRRGASVLFLEDLTRGIGAPATFAPRTGNVREVVATLAQRNPGAVAEGRLGLAQSEEVLAALAQRAQPSFRKVPAGLKPAM